MRSTKQFLPGAQNDCLILSLVLYGYVREFPDQAHAPPETRSVLAPNR